MSQTIDLPAKLLEYLNEARAPLPPISDPDQPLQIDSLGLIRLVSFMESELNIRIEDEELLAENFANSRVLSQLLAKKRQATAADAGAQAAGNN
jgi:acyl carrier protein